MAAPQSPLTGIIEEDQVFVDFGEHEGKSILEVAETLPEFYQNLVQGKDDGTYVIKRNKDKTYRLFQTRTYM